MSSKPKKPLVAEDDFVADDFVADEAPAQPAAEPRQLSERTTPWEGLKRDLGATARQMGRGATFGQSDEAGGFGNAMRSLIHPEEGQSFQAAYLEGRDKLRALEARDVEQMNAEGRAVKDDPSLKYLPDFLSENRAGAAELLGGAIVPGAGASGYIGKGATAGERIGRAGAVGAGYGAVGGLGAVQGANPDGVATMEENLAGTMAGAATGMTLGGAMHGASEGSSALGKAYRNTDLAAVKEQAARAHAARYGLTLPGVDRSAGGRGTVDRLDEVVGPLGMQSRDTTLQKVRDAIAKRNESRAWAMQRADFEGAKVPGSEIHYAAEAPREALITRNPAGQVNPLDENPLKFYDEQVAHMSEFSKEPSRLPMTSDTEGKIVRQDQREALAKWSEEMAAKEAEAARVAEVAAARAADPASMDKTQAAPRRARKGPGDALALRPSEGLAVKPSPLAQEQQPQYSVNVVPEAAPPPNETIWNPTHGENIPPANMSYADSEWSLPNLNKEKQRMQGLVDYTDTAENKSKAAAADSLQRTYNELIQGRVDTVLPEQAGKFKAEGQDLAALYQSEQGLEQALGGSLGGTAHIPLNKYQVARSLAFPRADALKDLYYEKAAVPWAERAAASGRAHGQSATEATTYANPGQHPGVRAADRLRAAISAGGGQAVRSNARQLAALAAAEEVAKAVTGGDAQGAAVQHYLHGLRNPQYLKAAAADDNEE